MDKLAIIGSGYMARNIAEIARGKGVYTLCFSNDENAVAKPVVDEFRLISIFDTDRIIDVCKKAAVGGVIATTELTVYIAAYVAHALGLNGNSPEIMEHITDKLWVRERTSKLDEISSPDYLEVSSASVKIDKYPVIVKPAQLGGKRGISVVRNATELDSALEYARDAIGGRNQSIIVEEYLSGGREYSVESLSYHGKHTVVQVTEKISSGPPHCVELGHMQPANIDSEARGRVEAAVNALLSALKIDNGTSHTEIKIIDGKVYLIELNCRPGGDHISYPLTDLSTGISFLGGAIDIALDKYVPPAKSAYKRNYAGVMFVTKQTAQLLPMLNECRKYPWCYRVNKVSEDLVDIDHNDGYNTNYFMYYSENGFPKELVEYVDTDKARR